MRGAAGEPAGVVLSRINDDNRYRFDQACRVAAVETAARLGMDCMLSINFMPNAVYDPARCLQTTLQAARRCDFPQERIIFEFTEEERIVDHGRLREIVEYYQKSGFNTAIDDFGAGYAGLNLLADLHSDLIKLDMKLVRGIEKDPRRRSIVKAILLAASELGINPIAEGVETLAEYQVLRDLGIQLFQGYLFARPELEALPRVRFPE
ncbi:MAG: EAL domain-containing protein [Spongiibacteraceae bacterium]|nr:EAL domain-containing protein [Spongiibacteraceae bacterium]